MSPFDIGLIIIIMLFALYGLWKGVIKIIFSIVAMVVSIVAAYLFAGDVAAWLGKFIPWGEAARQNLAFFLVIIVVGRVVGFAFWIINKTVGFLWRLPFISSLNRLLGAVFGLLEGVVVVGIVLAFLISHASGEWLITQLGTSQLVPMLAQLGAAFLPGISDVMDLLSELSKNEAVKETVHEIIINTASST